VGFTFIGAFLKVGLHNKTWCFLGGGRYAPGCRTLCCICGGSSSCNIVVCDVGQWCQIRRWSWSTLGRPLQSCTMTFQFSRTDLPAGCLLWNPTSRFAVCRIGYQLLYCFQKS